MRKKSKNYSGKKKNVQNNAKKSRKAAAEDVSPIPVEDSLSVLPIENSPQLTSEAPLAPSTSQNTTEKAIKLLEPDELMKINQKVNFLLDKCFQNKSEIVVNRRVLEDIVSDTLGHFYSQDDKFKNITETKHLTEKCKILQTEQIKLNRQRYALKKQVEDAKHIIKKMIDEKHLFNRGIIRRILPPTMKRQVRSVGLQVCLVGPMFVSKPVLTYSTSITSQYTETFLPPEVHHTARKRTVNKDVDFGRNNDSSAIKISQPHNSRAPPKKESPSENPMSKVTTRRKSVESSNNRVLTNKENPSGSNLKITGRRMSTRKTKVDDEAVPLNPSSSVKVKSIKELNNKIKNCVKVGDYPKIDIKGFENGLNNIIKQEKNEPITIKEEVMDEEVYDVVEISEDEDIEETITERKEDTKIIDKKEAGTQFNVNYSTDENSCDKFTEASSSQGAALIKVRSPEFINEHLVKSLNSSSTTKGENISFCQLPKYPVSPKYPPDVSKPPAPILQVGKKSNVETQGIMLTWSFACRKPENIVEYQLFAYQERNGRNNSNDVWKKVGDIKALPLPMACYLSQFVEDETYHFIIRAVDSHKRLGDFSIPAGIKLQKLDPSLKTPGGTIFKVPSPQNKL